MPFSINLVGEKILVKQSFQTQQILSSLILSGHQSKPNFNLDAKFSDIMKNIVESADLSMGSKIKEIQTGCIINAKGDQVIENLKKQIMSSGISLDKLVVDEQALTALSNFLVDAGFDEEEVLSRIDACKTINNKSELRLSDLFAVFSELRESKSDKEQEPLLEISALPHIESILSRLEIEPERIKNAMADATIESKGINIDLLVSNLKKVIDNSPDGKLLVLDKKDQNEIKEIINPIGSENKIFKDGSITLEGFVAGLETLLDRKSDFFQSSCPLSRDLNTFLKNIEIDEKVKDYSVIPGLVETISEIETSDIEESKWFHFQLNKEKIESNTLKSLINPWLNEKRESDLEVSSQKEQKPDENIFIRTISSSEIRSESSLFETLPIGFEKDEDSEISDDSEGIVSINYNSQVNLAEGLDNVESANKENPHQNLMPADLMHWIGRQISDGIEKGQNEINFDLQSLGLGFLQVNIENTDDRLEVYIAAEQQRFKEMLVVHADDFRAALRKQKSPFKSLEIQNHNLDSSISDPFDKLIQSDGHQIQPTQKATAVTNTASAMRTSSLKKYRQFDFEKNHAEIGLTLQEYKTNQLATEERIGRVEGIFESKENFEYLNATNSDSETNTGPFETNRVEDKLSGMDRGGDLKQVGAEISLGKRVVDLISEQLLGGINGEMDFEISKVAAESIPVNFLSDNLVNEVTEIEKFTIVQEKKLEGKQLPIDIMDPVDKHIFRDAHKSQNEGSFDPKPAISENLQSDVEKDVNRLKVPITIEQVPVGEILIAKSRDFKVAFIDQGLYRESFEVQENNNFIPSVLNSRDKSNNSIKEEQIEDVKRILEPEKRVEHSNIKSELMDGSGDARETITDTFLAPNIKSKSLALPSHPEAIEDGDFEISKTTTRIFPSETSVIMASDTREYTSAAKQNFWNEHLSADITDQVNRQILRSIHKGKNEINLELKPSGLGRLHLHIENHDDALKVSILAEHQFAKEILVAHTGDLKVALMDQGLCLESLDIRTSYNFDQSLANSKQESNKSNDRRRKGIGNKDRETEVSFDRVSESTRRNMTMLDLVA